MKSDIELRDAFCWLMENEQCIREHLNLVIPEYIKKHIGVEMQSIS